MNTKRFFFASVAVFAFVFVFEFILHGQLLMGLYEQTMHLWRPQEDCQMPFMIVSQLLFSFFFVFLFTRHYEAKGLAEGLRYGLWVGLLFAAVNLGSYCYMPIPFSLTLSWMVGDLLKCLGSGVVASLVYKN